MSPAASQTSHTASRLVVIAGPDAGVEFIIPARGGGIGRGHWNAIQLTDPQVSRSHCSIEIHEGHQVLVDVGSFSGTRVNGDAIARHVLAPDDIIALGSTELCYTVTPPESDWADEHTAVRAPVGSEILAGRYEILGLIGVGGMGSVYRVRDRELDEIVALKALRRELSSSSDMQAHFRREVKLARRVAHKNIARMFDIGEHHGQRFLTMEFIDGEPLSSMLARRGSLPARDAREIALDLCEGLDALHRAEIIHRDLKPDNILIAIDGRVVITDFGIAFDPGLAGVEHAVPSIAGTAAYMAPELLHPGNTSGRHTDVYSLGCVLFEMVTGQPPWTGQSPVEIITARLFSPPPDPRGLEPSVPDGLAEIILRCLAREPADRYTSVVEVRDALREVEIVNLVDTTPLPDFDKREAIAAKTEKRVVVLPVRNLGSAEDDHLSEGLTSELMDTLAMTQGVQVYSHAHVARCVTPLSDPCGVGRELDAQVVVEGSVLRSADLIQVHARVLNVVDGFQLWEETFEFDTGNLLVISDRAVRSIVEALALTSSGHGMRSATDPEAIELYLRGRSEYRKFWPKSVAKALEYFEQARAHAPEDPSIISACAMAHARLLFFEAGSDQATELAQQAIALAPNHADAHLALAMARFHVNDLQRALEAVGRAISLSPKLADAHLLLGRILLECGPLREAERSLERATSLDPLLYTGLRDLARARLLSGQPLDVVKDTMRDVPDIADAYILKSLELARLAMWVKDRRLAQEALDMLDDREQYGFAREIARNTLALLDDPANTEWHFPIQIGQTNQGSVRRVAFFSQLNAEIAACRGDTDTAIQRISEAVDLGLADINWLTRCEVLQQFQGEPAFEHLRIRVRARAEKILASWQRV